MNTPTLQDKAIRERYERDGFLQIPKLLDDDECAELKAEALRVIAREGKGATVMLGVSHFSPRFRTLASDERLVSVLREIMPDGIMFWSDKFVYKSNRQRSATPWHIDAAYWQNSRPKLSVWIPLDDATRHNGTLKLVPGSHLRHWSHERGALPHASVTEAGEQERAGPIVNFGGREPDGVHICELRRGGAVIFSDKTLHASCENAKGEDRYTLVGTYHAPPRGEETEKVFEASRIIWPGHSMS